MVAPTDTVLVDGRPVARQQLAYVLLNKPAGVVTTASDPQRRPTVVSLVDHPSRVVPVGRLDVETTGALLLTNDGDLAYRLAHPRFGVEKTYVATVRGTPTDETIARLAAGVELEDGPTAPARVRRISPSRLELVLHEGRNRQVRRMLEAVDHPALRLHRSNYAGLGLMGLDRGAWRELTNGELERLRAAASSSRPKPRARSAR
jgi:23S rRNA pseudouridine2605 synthase